MTEPTHSDVRHIVFDNRQERRRMTSDERLTVIIKILHLHGQGWATKKIHMELKRVGVLISRSRVYEIIERNR